MAQFDYDLVVIGAGSGGVGLARRAALYGAKVAICEQSEYGGTCVHRGCVPKKLMVYASALRSELALLPGYGFEAASPAFDWSKLIANKDKELDRLNGVYRKLLDGSEVTRLEGSARVLDAHTVQVGDKRVSGKYLAIAVGGKAWVPDKPGKELAITSDELFHLEKLPKSITLMGSGYIGLEFAGVFAGLGSEVTVMFRSELPLPEMDGDVRKTLKEQMEHKGIRFVTGANLDKLSKAGEEIEVHTDQGSWKTEVFVAATGRVPNTAGLGLEQAGVNLGEKGEVLTDEHCRTSVASIFAVGDCVGGVQLTPYAIAQGRALAARLFQDPNADFRPHHVPTAVFTQPAVGTVGLTQEQAEESNPGDIEVYRTSFRPMKYTLPDKPEKVMMKLVVRRSNQLVLGCHMVGSDAPEIIQALAIALTCGASKQDFDRTLAVHPTAAEEFVLLRDPVSTQT